MDRIRVAKFLRAKSEFHGRASRRCATKMLAASRNEGIFRGSAELGTSDTAEK